MKKKIPVLLLSLICIMVCLTGCETQADRVSYNLSQEADNFNVVREITVINCIQGDVLFQMSGRMSITVDEAESQLEIIVENDKLLFSIFIVLASDVFGRVKPKFSSTSSFLCTTAITVPINLSTASSTPNIYASCSSPSPPMMPGMPVLGAALPVHRTRPR